MEIELSEGERKARHFLIHYILVHELFSNYGEQN